MASDPYADFSSPADPYASFSARSSGAQNTNNIAPPQAPPNPALDAANQATIGLSRGAIETVGAIPDAASFLRSAANKGFDYLLGPAPPMPDEANVIGGAALNQAAAKAIPGLAEQPQTTLGQYARTAGEFVPGALLTGGNPLANALRYGVVPGVASEAAGQATTGSPMEGPARMAAAIAGGAGAGSVLTGAKQAAGEAIPTAENIGALKNAAYARAKELGAAYTPEAYSGLIAKIQADAKAADMNPELTPKTASFIKNLQNIPENEGNLNAPVSLTALDQKRQVANDELMSSHEGREAKFGKMIKNNIDQFIANPEPFAQPKTSAAPFDPDRTMPIQPGPGSPTWNRYLQRLADYSDKTRDLYDLAVEHEIVNNRDEFANPTQTQAKGISDLIDKFKNDPAFTGIGPPPERPLPPSGYIEGSAPNPEAPMPKPPPAAPSAMAAGAAPEAAAAIQNARDLNTRYEKLQSLTEALQGAQYRAGKNQVYNIDAATRQKLLPLLENGNWSPQEKSLLESSVMGSPAQNALRWAGKFSPGSGFFPALAEIGTAGAGHVGPALAMALGGEGAKQASKFLANRNIEQLRQTILAGGKAPLPIVNPQPRQLGALLAGVSSRNNLPAPPSPQ
jgi:hypothetical protein